MTHGVSLVPEWLERRHPVIGMLHAPPLPGAPHYDGDWPAVVKRVCDDAETLTAGGVDGLMLENFGDAPFLPGRVEAVTVAAMTALAHEVTRRFPLPLGINVLRNDGRSALAIAAVVGARFIRVNVLCGARVTDQGIITGIAHDLLRERAALGATNVRILADVDVKHSAPLAPRSLVDETHELVARGGADAVIVSGAATGQASVSTTCPKCTPPRWERRCSSAAACESRLWSRCCPFARASLSARTSSATETCTLRSMCAG